MSDDEQSYPDPPMEQAEVDQALLDEIRDAMIDGIPEWERAGYDRLVEMVNSDDEIEDDAIPERDIDWELKAERENSL